MSSSTPPSSPARSYQPALNRQLSTPLILGLFAIPLVLCGIVAAVALAKLPQSPIAVVWQWLNPSTPTPQPPAENNKIVAGGEATDGSGPTPTPIKVDIPVQEPPTPSEQKPDEPPPPAENPLPDPVDFIFTYYNAINSRDYSSAWAHLSQNFVDHKSQQLGRTYTYQEDYAGYWETVDHMEILEASTESQDSQSAVLLLKLRWNMLSGVSPEYNHRFYLVRDPQSDTWLIDATETWK
jgi:hypothetical protein